MNSIMNHMFCSLFITFLGLIFLAKCSQVKRFPLLMPNVRSTMDDSYFCTPARIVPDKEFYIVGFEPNATMNVVHHMLLFACEEPGADALTWNCGNMGGDDNVRMADPCSKGSHVIYAWARDAKTLVLPKDVGFQVGKGTDLKYLVMQVHYAHKFAADAPNDRSGIILRYTEQPQRKLAGIYLLASLGSIPPHAISHLEMTCPIREPKVIHPFAFRTHTHGLGRVVSGYRVRRDQNGKDHWTLLGKMDPLKPQMFYPIFSKESILPGDRLAARCTIDSSSRNEVTYIGATNKDEMCNFYLMAYVENTTFLEQTVCSNTPNSPHTAWVDEGLNNIPDVEASQLLNYQI